MEKYLKGQRGLNRNNHKVSKSLYGDLNNKPDKNTVIFKLWIFQKYKSRPLIKPSSEPKLKISNSKNKLGSAEKLSTRAYSRERYEKILRNQSV